MNEILIIILLIMSVVSIILILNLLKKSSGAQNSNELKEEFERMDKSFRDELSRNRDEFSKSSKAQREELNGAIKLFGDQLGTRLLEVSKMQKSQLDIFSDQLTKLTQTNEQKFDKLQERVETQLKEIQENNSKKLDEMRRTVDEKLHDTLEKRLGESFNIVSKQLEAVHKGLGEMQNLAIGVGDLKKVLSNVKTRGILGEYQLENILEQIMAPDQYAKNVVTKSGSRENVEFAIKIPSKDADGKFLWLPLDSKFPQERYRYLLEAYDSGDVSKIESEIKELEKAIRQSAKDIKEKYLEPPNTTDFGIMFLPFEGLYAEVAKRPGLVESLQRDFKVMISGPSNLFAFLSSLQMGFRTLAIEKRTSEVWSLLGAVKTEFGKFGDVLEKTQEKLRQASDTIDSAKTRTRAIERKLKDVQELPSGEQSKLIE